MSSTKSLFKSKTFYANLLAIVLLVAGRFGVAPVELNPETETLILAVLNIVLRLITRTAVYIR